MRMDGKCILCNWENCNCFPSPITWATMHEIGADLKELAEWRAGKRVYEPPSESHVSYSIRFNINPDIPPYQVVKEERLSSPNFRTFGSPMKVTIVADCTNTEAMVAAERLMRQ